MIHSAAKSIAFSRQKAESEANERIHNSDSHRVNPRRSRNYQASVAIARGVGNFGLRRVTGRQKSVMWNLPKEICRWLVEKLAESVNNNKQKAILQRLAEMEWRIMSAISDYTTRVDAKFDGISTSVDEIVASQAGIATDVGNLKDIILKLQDNTGPISPEDQALLDAGVVKITALAEKTAAVSAALKELDAATETAPVAPVEPAV